MTPAPDGAFVDIFGGVFAEPTAGLALVAVACGAWALMASDRRRARRLAAVVGRRAGVLASEQSPRRVRLRSWLGALGVALCVLAWMQPRIGSARRTAAASGTDLCVCLDVSRSMLARDLPPSRLRQAQAAIGALAERTRGDRLALVLFAGAARLRVPVTRDVASLAELANGADPADVSLGGTNLGAAIDAAVSALAAAQSSDIPDAPEAATDPHLEGAVLLITDGEDPSGSGRAAAERARALGLRVHCVGLGSALGSKITVTGADGRETFLRDRDGREVVSRMNAADLRALAAAGGGIFVDGGASAAPLVEVYERGVIPELSAARGAAANTEAERANRYQLPLGLGIAVLLVELLLAGRRRSGTRLALRGGLR